MPAPVRPDVIVTGLPRSGATLVSALIDGLPNAVCLSSPQEHLIAARSLPAMHYCKWLVGEFAWTRAALLRQEPVSDFRAADGSALLDGLRDSRQPRDEAGARLPAFFTRDGIKANFMLGAKHHALYTSVLPGLATLEHFTIMAVIRHPLDVIASWQTITKGPIGQGRLPEVAKRFWPEGGCISESEGDLLDRMAQLYEAYIQRYHELREQIHIVRYEEVVRQPMRISELLGRKKLSNAAGAIAFRPSMRVNVKDDALRERLRRYGVFTKYYYADI